MVMDIDVFSITSGVNMTLYRKLLLTVLLIFSSLLFVVFFVQFTSTREYLRTQQESDIFNTATSLGLSLTPFLETDDRAGAESIINVVFDGSYYGKIGLYLFASETQLLRENPRTIAGVPDWFTELDLFTPIKHSQILNNQWMQYGRLTVQGHPGFAYRELWLSSLDLLKWFAVIFILSSLLLMRAIKHLLQPLQQIKEKADAVILHDFGEPLPLPDAIELRSVVEAINGMSSTLSQQFKVQSEEAEALRKHAYQDLVSQLGNRAYFVAQLDTWVNENGVGGVILLAVDILEAIYREEGFSARDNLVRSVANMLSQHTEKIEHAALARISATEFAIILPGYEAKMLQDFSVQMNAKITDLVVNPIANVAFVSVIGIAVRHQQEDASALLTKADNALQQARQLRNGAVYIHADAASAVLGRLSWKRLVTNAIAHRSLCFMRQPVHNMEGVLLHEEIFTSIKNQTDHYAAGQFMPAVEQFKLGCEFDLCVLDMLLPHISCERTVPITVNLSISALISGMFKQRLLIWLQQHKDHANMLMFEIPEAALVKHNQVVLDLLKKVNEVGFDYGIDQFGRHFESLDYLSILNPKYVKIDHGYTQKLAGSETERQFLGAICRAAHNLSIQTIATRIEHESQLQLLSTVHVDGYQGFIHPSQTLG
ncbi:MAG: diguanylate cyclase (GGDEF)-like protein [Moritella sp.]|jgi:diguanylate cyclase (GGDEF)-like protein